MRNKQFYTRTALICSILFILLAIWVKIAGKTQGLPLDTTFQKIAWATRTGFGNFFFTFYTHIFGDFTGVIFAVIVFLLLATVLHRRKGSLWFAVSAIAVQIINTIIKHLVGRVRPDTNRLSAFIHQSGASFASGHSAFAVIFFGCIFLLFYRQVKSQTKRKIFAAICIIGLLLVMFSRVYVGVHYPSDTVGGVLLGVAWLSFSYPYFLKYSRRKIN